MQAGESIGGGKDFVFRNAIDADRLGKPAVVRARFVGTGFAFEPLGLGMQWGEPFGQLRAEDGERRHATRGREMAGAGIVADEDAGAVDEREKLPDGSGHCDRLFAGLQPPIALVVVASDLHLVPAGAKPDDETRIAFQRPDAHGLPGAGVDEDFLAGTRPLRHGNNFARWEFEI